MRPYLAIIKDSFREAMASRVLWVLLLLITAVMIGLLPFHLISTIAAKVDNQDIRSIRTMSNALKAGAEAGAPKLTQHVWERLTKEARDRIVKLDVEIGPAANSARRLIARDFNTQLEREDFYDAELWADVELGSRAEALLEKKPLTGDDLKQFNRLALEAALPGQLKPCPEEAVSFRYATWDLSFMPSLRRSDANSIIDQFTIGFMGVFVGFFGIFAGVLVTAPIIPDMLNSGSLYVLLSKPVARPLLFVSKFLGGCSFVAINASYLIVGLWLILGLRFGLWKPQLLWSIPLFLFSFAIFYSVSALSGLVWRSAIMAVVATILFWFMCTAVGVTRGTLQQFVMVPDQISRIVSSGDELFVSKVNGQLSRWDQSTNELTEVMENVTERNRRGPEMMMGSRSNMVSLVYDRSAEQLIGLEQDWSTSRIVVGSKQNGWLREKSLPARGGAKALFLRNGQPVVVASGGVFPVELEAKPVKERKGSNILGLFTIPALPQEETEPKKLSNDLGRLPADALVAYDSSADVIYVYGGRELQSIGSVDDLFQVTKNIDIEVENAARKIAAGGDVVALAFRENETVRLRCFDEQLEMIAELDTGNENEIRELTISNDGRFLACLFQSDELILFDLKNDRQVKTIPSRQSIAGVSFAEEELLLAKTNDEFVALALDDFRVTKTVSPQLPLIKKLYRYFVNPLFLVFPKPSELQNTMQYVVTGKETIKVEGPGFGPNGRTVKLEPWQPLLSNSLFIGTMLLIGCIYVFRQDF